MENQIKICTKCKREYPATPEYFNKRWSSVTGLDGWCKNCCREYRNSCKEKLTNYFKQYHLEHKEEKSIKGKKYYQEHKEERKEYARKYREENKDIVKERDKKYRYNNKEKFKIRDKVYAEKNKEKIKLKQRQYREKNAEKLRQKKREYYQNNKSKINAHNRNKLKNNLSCRILSKLRSRMWWSLKKQNASKMFHMKELIGCSVDDLKKYLESKFLPGMTRDNYGRKGWHIDHIIPCAVFDLTKPEEQRRCFYYTNLQPLWELDNFKKNSFYNGKFIRNENI